MSESNNRSRRKRFVLGASQNGCRTITPRTPPSPAKLFHSHAMAKRLFNSVLFIFSQKIHVHEITMIQYFIRL